MTRRSQVDALAIILERTLEVQRARRFLEVEFAWVEVLAGTEAMAAADRPRALRIRRVVESCRDEHLASLDADDGLTALGIGWQEVVLTLRRHRRERAAIARRRRCLRCQDKMEPLKVFERPRGMRTRTRSRGIQIVYRCPWCGLSTRP